MVGRLLEHGVNMELGISFALRSAHKTPMPPPPTSEGEKQDGDGVLERGTGMNYYWHLQGDSVPHVHRSLRFTGVKCPLAIPVPLLRLGHP